jgi:hypothetical protein
VVSSEVLGKPVEGFGCSVEATMSFETNVLAGVPLVLTP